ncbi:MAG: histidine triad nucleotide-binding protein [Oscillospiraceae bacterium]|nr:histidine triad nucleotide-binding protein [Oscillospiraceae bacterium]
MNCIFCKIAAGEIPSDKVYEDDRLVAFNDINPQTRVHALVVPKEHIAGAAALTEDHAEIMGRLWTAIPKIAALLGVSEAFKVSVNSGADAGQTVFHLHFHLQSP